MPTPSQFCIKLGDVGKDVAEASAVRFVDDVVGAAEVATKETPVVLSSFDEVEGLCVIDERVVWSKVVKAVVAFEIDTEVSIFVETDDEKLTVEGVFVVKFRPKADMFLQDLTVFSEIKYKSKKL